MKTAGRRAGSLARRLVVAATVAALSVGAMAEGRGAAPAGESGFVAWVRSVGRAIGLAFRDIGSEGKRVGLAVGHGAADAGKKIGHGAADAGKEIGHGAAKVGKEIGQGAAKAGKGIGQAAKQGGKALRNALTGKGADRDSSN